MTIEDFAQRNRLPLLIEYVNEPAFGLCWRATLIGCRLYPVGDAPAEPFFGRGPRPGTALQALARLLSARTLLADPLQRPLGIPAEGLTRR